MECSNETRIGKPPLTLRKRRRGEKQGKCMCSSLHRMAAPNVKLTLKILEQRLFSISKLNACEDLGESSYLWELWGEG